MSRHGLPVEDGGDEGLWGGGGHEPGTQHLVKLGESPDRPCRLVLVLHQGSAMDPGPEALPLLHDKVPGTAVYPTLTHPLQEDSQVTLQVLSQVCRNVLGLALQNVTLFCFSYRDSQADSSSKTECDRSQIPR